MDEIYEGISAGEAMKGAAAIEHLFTYRQHADGCEYHMTEFCTCGMREAVIAARTQLLDLVKEDDVSLPVFPKLLALHLATLVNAYAGNHEVLQEMRSVARKLLQEIK